MPDEFVTLAAFVRPLAEPEPAPAEEPAAPPQAGEAPLETSPEFEDALAAVRRFRASLAEALDRATATVLEDVAIEVVARELRLAPCDLGAIVARALERYRECETPLLLRAHPGETALLQACGAPVVADDRLRRGDVLIELRSGTIDATLGARIAQVAERWNLR